jgi:nucleotide-binding universal stress UspA family protein
VTSASIPHDQVLVGVDGSDGSRAAVRWAADEARRLGVPLRLVHAWVWPLYHVRLGPPAGAPAGAGLRAQAEGILTEAAAVARAVSPLTPVESTLLTGAAAPMLLSCAKDARMLVVGSRGLGGFSGLLVGSVGVAVSARAACMVVVVRGTATAGDPVLVGVDGSPRSNRAVSTAFQEASRRGVGLIALHAWTIPLREETGSAHGYPAALKAGRAAGQELMDKVLAQWQPLYPDVEVSLRLGDRSPAAELVAAAADAQLVVVGSADVGSVKGLVFGSTSHALIHHATCPVLIDRG